MAAGRWGGQTAHLGPRIIGTCAGGWEEAGGGGRTAGEGSASWAESFYCLFQPSRAPSRTRVGGSSTGCSLSPVPLSCFNWQVPIHRGREGGQGLARRTDSPRHQPRRSPRGQIPRFYWVSGSSHCGVPTKLCCCCHPQALSNLSGTTSPSPSPQPGPPRSHG